MIFVCIGRILPSIHENEKKFDRNISNKSYKGISTLTTSEKL